MGPQIVTLSVRRFRGYQMMPGNFETLLLQLDDKSDCGRFYSPFTRSLGAPQQCFESTKTCSPTIGDPRKIETLSVVSPPHGSVPVITVAQAVWSDLLVEGCYCACDKSKIHISRSLSRGSCRIVRDNKG